MELAIVLCLIVVQLHQSCGEEESIASHASFEQYNSSGDRWGEEIYVGKLGIKLSKANPRLQLDNTFKIEKTVSENIQNSSNFFITPEHMKVKVKYMVYKEKTHLATFEYVVKGKKIEDVMKSFKENNEDDKVKKLIYVAVADTDVSSFYVVFHRKLYTPKLADGESECYLLSFFEVQTDGCCTVIKSRIPQKYLTNLCKDTLGML